MHLSRQTSMISLLRKILFGLMCSFWLSEANAIPVVPVQSEQVTEVIYPPPQSPLDTRDNDFIEILRTALEKTTDTYGPFTLHPTEVAMNPLRFRHEIMEGRGPNVIWASVSQEREEHLLSIKIPLRKGILGYRLLLINQTEQHKFSSVTNQGALLQFRAGQGSTWIDSDILRTNGFTVVTGSSYEGLFRMLMSGRFDFFPRGINEIYPELEKRHTKYPNMVIEPHIMLYYPLPKFFYVNKNNKKLAERLRYGLNIMLKDGSFDRIFIQYNQHHIDNIHSSHWRVFTLTNPFLPEDIPFEQKELWYDLTEDNN